MNKQELLKDYKNQEDKLLLAVVLDKIEFCKNKNKIECTDFLNLAEQDLVDKFLKRINFKNYYFFGGAGEKNINCVSGKTYRGNDKKKSFENDKCNKNHITYSTRRRI